MADQEAVLNAAMLIPETQTVVFWSPQRTQGIICVTGNRFDSFSRRIRLFAYMQAPPPVLAGLYVVAYAHADAAVVFEQRYTLNVDGEWLGRVPCLAICQDFDTGEYAIQHCSDDWEPLGIAAGYSSLDEAKSRIEHSYHGISDKWILSTTSLEDARALNDAEHRARACSFCGRTAHQYRTIIGESVRICGQCVDEFHAAIHADNPTI